MDPERTFVAPTVIAVLRHTLRITAFRQMLAGNYGPVIRRGLRNTPYVPLAAVENYHGVTFDQAQVEIAVAGKLDRLFTLPMSESETVEAA